MIYLILVGVIIILGLVAFWAIRSRSALKNNYQSLIQDNLTAIGSLQKRNHNLKATTDELLKKVKLSKEKREMIQNETYTDISAVSDALSEL